MPADGRRNFTRRQMLLRLGLAAGALYTAPALTRLSSARASSGGSASFSASRIRRVRPEIVVAAPDAADIERIAARGYAVLGRSRLALLNSEFARLRLPAGVTVVRARQQILELVPDALFDLNHLYRPNELRCEDDRCDAADMIGWNAKATSCTAATAIGMIDTSVNIQHDALRGAEIELVQGVSKGRMPSSNAHGTAVAALLAGAQDSRTPGLLDGARLVAVSAFHRDSRGQDAADVFDLARAFDLLISRDVRVLNLSFAGPHNIVLEGVCAAARARNAILIAAAGNAGPRAKPLFPAGYESVVAVTAVDRQSRIYRQANRGEHIDFAAPGVRLWTAAGRRGGRFRSGTSYAVPFVSAVFAVAQSRMPERPVDELIQLVAGHAADLGPPGRDSVYGWGLVQADGVCEGARVELFAPLAGFQHG